MLQFSQHFEAENIRSEFVVLPIAGGPALYHLNVPYGAALAAFTPDSKAISFLLTRNRATNVWKQPLTGGDPTQITHFDSGEIFSYAWSHDGKQLGLTRGRRKSDVVMISNFR